MEAPMGLLDRLLGRSKKAAGDLMNDPELRREGAHQESAGAAEDRARMHEEQAVEERRREASERAAQDTTNP
jgi:uncharacterized protein YjbJ (UPF0337 family)